jgi:hypothetical protein
MFGWCVKVNLPNWRFAFDCCREVLSYWRQASRSLIS